MNAPSTLLYPIDDIPEAGQWLTVMPGVQWLRMPLPFALDHINLWILDDGDTVTLVDTGFGLPDIQALWEAALDRLTKPVGHIIVTHYHPDHLGLADWLSQRTGAPIWMTQGEFLTGHALWHQLPGFSTEDMLEQFRHHGLDATRLDALKQRGNRYRSGVPSLPRRYNRLIHGDCLSIGGHDWKVITGYGHAPEHAALWCATRDLLISGDMLLPRISTNVSVFAATPNDDPLRRFLESIHHFNDLPERTLVLPSHGRPFQGIRARVSQLVTHHAERCDELLAACQEPRTAAQLLETLFPRELDTHQVMFAMGEAIAHLNYLAHGRDLREVDDGDDVVRFISTAHPSIED
ncbi:MAG TPA: MBL fold metallo-hydrolase [Denitromonas sp.]|uniref:MBL fold metallo-hydrolase n=1 Tax=Denitromonas sp. TaxID=2734609 RepID=UPI001D20969B|nr:MBL fold metallo-hydrolase [Rhodocyclaceae bacterium]MCP5222424.1 MBL fold metallo-hydrolase [Zoogloeaceae bacterium]HQU88761.1 MBL fold metallo-hydrolase [Denitromonas sp.]HQV15059.1 MBL fold metallo-hydrolase [Denitromonas sp.]